MFFGLKISEGAIANMAGARRNTVRCACVEIAQLVRNSPVIAATETSARVCGKTHWQWTFLQRQPCINTIAPTRGKAVPAPSSANPSQGVAVDRLAVRENTPQAHPVLLAHLIRDAQYAIDAGDAVFAPLSRLS